MDCCRSNLEYHIIKEIFRKRREALMLKKIKVRQKDCNAFFNHFDLNHIVMQYCYLFLAFLLNIH
jgi:hypothetical protein